MKFANLAQFFDFIEQLSSNPVNGPIIVRCPDVLASCFSPWQLHAPYLSSLQYIERRDRNQQVLYCLNSENIDADDEALLAQQAQMLEKPLLWVVPHSHKPLVLETHQRCLRVFVGAQSELSDESNRPLRDLLLPQFQNLPHRSTPDQEAYLQSWLKAFNHEMAQHSPLNGHQALATQTIDIILGALAYPAQKYLVFRQIKWALFRYMRGIKKQQSDSAA